MEEFKDSKSLNPSMRCERHLCLSWVNLKFLKWWRLKIGGEEKVVRVAHPWGRSIISNSVLAVRPKAV